MPSWTLTLTHPTQGRTFQRPLDPTELAFFWDGRFNGTEDSLHHAELRLLNASRDVHIFSDANIVKAWLSTKRRHPLAGATVQVLPLDTPIVPCRLKEADSKAEGGGGDSVPALGLEPHFVIREHDLAVLRAHEIVFEQVACAEEIPQRMAAIWEGPRLLSDELLVRLYVFRETDPQRTDVLHLVTLIAHCVTDGTANRTFLRCLLDTLARGGELDSEPAQIPLEERLGMLIPSADLEPVHLRLHSPARRRWRRAIGAVIFQLRMEKGQGGHTLPCRRTRATQYIPARPGFISTLLTQAQTTTVLASCHLHELTFGCAYLALAQVAMTRVLYRRYLRGEISEEEWAYRKKQPHRSFGPLNLRPYLDKPWYERGGGGEFMLSINIFAYQLPFMTLGGTEPHQYHEQELSDGAPPFSDLLTFNRFLHRAGLVKKQAKAFFSHPLFFEFVRVASLVFAQHTHLCAEQWTKHAETANGIGTHGHWHDDEEVLAVTDMPEVTAHGGSSLGNVHLLFPTEYPLPPTHPLSPFSSIPHPARAGYAAAPPALEVDTTPRIVVENTMTRLHTRPAELYLGALSSRGRLSMYVFYDGNVYEEEVVSEWLDEVRGAVLWYLGQTQCGQDGDAPGQVA